MLVTLPARSSLITMREIELKTERARGSSASAALSALLERLFDDPLASLFDELFGVQPYNEMTADKDNNSTQSDRRFEIARLSYFMAMLLANRESIG
jgi:hypothetical protein